MITDHIETTIDLEATLEQVESMTNEEKEALLDPYSFSSRTLIQATFPHSAKAGKEIVLVNGNMKVTMYSPDGLPFGTYPRLIMCWLTREAIRRKSLYSVDEARKIPLGPSLTSFMREVGVRNITGGKNGTITAVQKQLKALFTTFISVEYTGVDHKGRKNKALDNTIVADSSFLWWDEDAEGNEDLAGSHVCLSKSFYLDLVNGSVPLNTTILREIKRSPLAIDLYSWATYRISYHDGFTRVSWSQIRQQFGATYPDTPQGQADFRRKVKEAVAKIKDAWPEAGIEVWEGGLILRGNSPSVPKRDQSFIRKAYDIEAPF